MSNISIDTHYNFSVYANSILGSSYSSAKLVAILNYNTAVKFGSIDLMHKQIYPYLPPGTPSDHTKYSYYLFEHRGKQIVLADYWIVPDSMESTEGASYTLTLNNVTTQEVALIRDQLRLLGISFSIV